MAKKNKREKRETRARTEDGEDEERTDVCERGMRVKDLEGERERNMEGNLVGKEPCGRNRKYAKSEENVTRQKNTVKHMES